MAGKRSRLLSRRGVRPSHKNEVWYRARLWNIVDTARGSFEPQLRKFITAAIKPENEALAPHIALTARNMVLSAARDYRLHAKPEAIATAAATMNLRAVDDQLGGQLEKFFGVRVPLPRPEISLSEITEVVKVPIGDAKIIQMPMKFGAQESMRNLMKKHIGNNVQLIRSIPDEYFDRIASDVYDNITQAKRWEELSDKLIHTLDYDFKITKSRANLIARDQTSKMNGAFNQERQTSVGVNSYRWQTAGDERVRPTHEANDGEVFDWDDPPEETGHPGNDVNCRCLALAVFEELELAA